MRALSDIIIIAIFMNSCFHTLVLGSRNLSLEYDSAFDNIVCNGANKLKIDSILLCANVCTANTSCHSIFFKETIGTCTLCADVYENPADTRLMLDAGTKYYRPYTPEQSTEPTPGSYGAPCIGTWSLPACVEANTVCYPIINMCVCHPEYIYNPTTGTCTQTCSAFGSTYQKYPRSVLLQNNHYIQQGISDVLSCLQSCMDYTGDICYGVDHNHIMGECHYYSTSVANAATKWRVDNANYDTYTRNCI